MDTIELYAARLAKRTALHARKCEHPDRHDDAFSVSMLQYGNLILSVQGIIDAVNNRFGEESFTQDRVLRIMRNQLPSLIREVFNGLPD